MLKKLIVFIIVFTLLPIKSYAFEISSHAAILIEANTRQIIYKNNADVRMGMASTTKIMTALVALENSDIKRTITISKNAERQEGSSIYLRAGDCITLEDLLYGLMLNSGNDAAMAIAESIGESSLDFVKKMNEYAVNLGCKDTHFSNPSGLPEKDHYSTARDMAIIMSHAMENKKFREIVSAKEYKIELPGSKTYLCNHNKLLWMYRYCVGGKTGYTKSNGRCLVSCAEKDGIKLIAVTLDDRDDWNDHISLFDYGFEKVKTKKIISKNDIISTRQIGNRRINLIAGEDFYIPVCGIIKSSCKIYIDNLPKNIEVGTQIGYADIYSGKYKISRIPLLSGQSFEEKNPFKRYVSIFIKNILLTKKHNSD